MKYANALNFSQKMINYCFDFSQNIEFDKAECALYEEVTLMKPFRRKTLVKFLTRIMMEN
jgi:hypothetical protein